MNEELSRKAVEILNNLPVKWEFLVGQFKTQAILSIVAKFGASLRGYARMFDYYVAASIFALSFQENL